MFYFQCTAESVENLEETDGHLSAGHSLEQLDSHLDVPPARRRADSLSVVTVDTADLDCQFTRPDQEQMDKMIEEETSKTGRVSHQYQLFPFVLFSHGPVRKKPGLLLTSPLVFHDFVNHVLRLGSISQPVPRPQLP